MEFIVIDDDPITLIISRRIISDTVKNSEVKTFLEAEKGLSYLRDELVDLKIPVILFLDLNMPVISGWDFLGLFDDLSAEIKNKVKIYIVSSSIDPCDKARALASPHVTDFISKPLTRKILLETLDKYDLTF